MSKMQKTLTMNRRGDFKVFTHGDSHCGTLTNQELPVQYHLVCECENVLDTRGFLFEQVGVNNFFQNMKKTKLSCEKLTTPFNTKVGQSQSLSFILGQKTCHDKRS